MEDIPGLAAVLVCVENAVQENTAHSPRKKRTVDSTENGTTRKT
jgi:hypothetical protein